LAAIVLHLYSVDLVCLNETSESEEGEMPQSNSSSDKEQNRIIEQIIELQREFYFENKGRDSDRRRRLREIIDRATSERGVQ
jgi:hypothetical protein